MVVGKQELSSSVAHQPLATGKAFGSELKGSKAERPANRLQPVGEKGQRQRMGRGDPQRLNRAAQPGSHVGARFIDLAAQRLRPGKQPPSRLCQRHGTRTAEEQGGSGPLLQGLDAPAEGRLGNMAPSGRAREAAAFR